MQGLTTFPERGNVSGAPLDQGLLPNPLPWGSGWVSGCGTGGRVRQGYSSKPPFWEGQKCYSSSQPWKPSTEDEPPSLLHDPTRQPSG